MAYKTNTVGRSENRRRFDGRSSACVSSAVRYRRRKARAYRIRLVSLAAVTAAACLAFLVLTLTLTARDAAADEQTVPIAYESVQVRSGDTLWSIAEEWQTDEWKDTRLYVQVIKEVNNLTSDTIHTGNYLIIPYYDHDLSHIDSAETAF